MKNLLICEFSNIFGYGEVRLPYSTGVLWSYCKADETISKNYKVSNWIYWKDEKEKIMKCITEKPDVALFSCNVWSWTLSNQIAKLIKQKWPECVVIYGGQMPPRSNNTRWVRRNPSIYDFFKDRPYVDIIAHHEGEETIKETMLELLNDTPDLSKVLSISYKNEDLTTSINQQRDRVKDLNEMPSPYLDGTFDKLISNKPKHIRKFKMTLEPSRGCPYACTFCEIGDTLYTKIERHSIEKICAELDWASENKIEFIDCADSNFGLFPEHKEMVEYMGKKKRETGYPIRFSVSWSKGHADRVMDIAKIMQEEELDKTGVTIALQSMNPDTLKAVKRKNIDNGKLAEFLKKYELDELDTYVELVMGLPLETLDTWIDGLCYLMEIGLHTSAKMFPCAALPNTPIAEKEYGELYGIQYAQIYESNHTPFYPVAQSGGWDIVIGTKSMPHEDWKQAYMFKWLVGGFHWLGMTQSISRYLRNMNDVSYRDFYYNLLKFAQENENTFIGSELKITLDSLEYAIANQFSLGRVIKEVDEDKDKNQLIWDYDEATAIQITLGNNREIFYKELRVFLKDYLDQSFFDELWDDLVLYQSNSIINPFDEYPFVKEFDYNIHSCTMGTSNVLKNGGYKIEFNQSWADNPKNKKGYFGDKFQFACEKLWWLRNRGEYKAKIREV
jgi:putative methyltransferase